MRKRLGFTLIELLIVVTIVSILAMAAFNTYQRSRWWSQVKLGREEVYRALLEARTAAQRFNMKGVVKTTTPRTLRLVLYDKGKPFRSQDYTLTPGTILERWHNKKWVDPTGFEITYLPPYAETDADPVLFRVRLVHNPAYRLCLSVFGVTGKVVKTNVCP